MGIFDIFTGDPGKEAAERSRALLTQTQNDITGRTNTTRDEAARYLTGGYRAARGNLGQGYDAATGAVRSGAGEALRFLDDGGLGAIGALGRARADLSGGYRPLADLAARYGDAARLYGDALGVNGAEGNARAAGAFHAGPGYQYLLDSSIDALNRRRNAAGSLASGNADADAIALGKNLANQEYAAWLDRLKDYNGLELNAVNGNLGVAKTLADLGVTEANLLNQAGRTKAGVATGEGTSLADIANRYFTGLAGFDTAEGGALAGNATNAANAINSASLNIAPRIGQTFKDEAEAEMAGSKAFWDALMGGANLALKASGVGGFGPPSFSLGGNASADPFRKGFARPNIRE